MSYLDREMVTYRDPRPPACTDEEAQRLRDLWRPSTQALWQPLLWRDPESGEIRDRDEDYDTTQVSLWMDYPMYVIPPDVAQPLKEELAEQVDGPMFDTVPDWERAVLHGAHRFMQRFLLGHRFGVSVGGGPGQADANFSRFGEPTSFLASGGDKHPRMSVPAPVLEKGIDHSEGEVRRVIDTDEDYGAIIFTRARRERQQREGILGWTIPFTHKGTNRFAHAIIRAKNHLVEVNWFDYPRERLNLTFRYPQLTLDGETMLNEAVAGLEHHVPEGTDYTDLYNYHEHVANWEYPRDVWRDTEEDRGKRQREYDEARRDWLRSQPRIQ